MGAPIAPRGCGCDQVPSNIFRPAFGQGDDMPLSINVGLSRKASKDYQSSGVSINVTAELDQSLLARPEELQEQIAGLYAQAELALDRQATAQPHNADVPPRRSSPSHSNGRGRNRSTGPVANGNGNGHGNGGGMTESQ